MENNKISQYHILIAEGIHVLMISKSRAWALGRTKKTESRFCQNFESNSICLCISMGITGLQR